MDLGMLGQMLYHVVSPAVSLVEQNTIIAALVVLNLAVVGLRMLVGREIQRVPAEARQNQAKH